MARIYGGPPSGDRLVDRRRTGIGGSDTGAILGVDRRLSALGLWEEKRGLVERPDVPTERMVWGKRLEAAILHGYAEDTGRHVQRARFGRHPAHHWLIGTPDGLAGDRLVEVKTTAVLDARWDEDTGRIPPAYYSQVQHYMVLTDRHVADVAVLVGGRELHVIEVERDAEFVEALLDEEHTFWQRVVTGEPPPPDGSDDAGRAILRMYPRAYRDEIVATPEVNNYARAYLSARAVAEAAARDANRWAQLMQDYMGSRERLVGDGFVATWPNRQGVVSWKRVAEDMLVALRERFPEAALDDWTEARRGAPTRAFTLTERERSE